MKYWRGYLVAALVGLCAWALEKFAMGHAALVDMFYPYVTRMGQSFLAAWSGAAPTCIWQVLVVAAGVLVLASAVLMVIFKWNPIQWFGWVLAGGSLVVLLTTGMYGLNEYAGPLSEDIRLTEKDYTIQELKDAAEFYRDQANELAVKISRDGAGNPQMPEFAELAQQAGEGFQVLTRQEFNSVFAGSLQPVKELGWSRHFAKKGVGCKLVALTGEAAVNPQAPGIYLPYGMCEVMARRMSIAVDRDAQFAAFLACRYNTDPYFRYSGYLMAYAYCEQALDATAETVSDGSLLAIKTKVHPMVAQDLAALRQFFGSERENLEAAELLVNWHIEKYVLPLQQEEQVLFDPLDETQVDLTGLVHAPTEPSGEGS